MKTEERIRKPEIKSLMYLSGRKRVERIEGQVFYQTPKAYELWRENPLFLIKRINRKSIGWVTTY